MIPVQRMFFPRALRAHRFHLLSFFCVCLGCLDLVRAESGSSSLDLFVPSTGSAVGADSLDGGAPPAGATVLGDGDAFEITFAFTSETTPEQQAVFETAAAIWDLVITGYQVDEAIGAPVVFGGTGATGPVITAGVSSDPPFGAPGGALATGGVTSIVAFDFVDPSATDFVLATTGVVTLDVADIDGLEASGLLLDTIVHEIGHVLGIGTLWDTSGISFVNGDGDVVDINGQVVSVDDTGEYTGEAGLAAFIDEFNAPAGTTAVPVELSGGPGTANAHFDETGVFTSGATGLGLNQEILTGFLGPAPNFLSTLSVQSLVDIGFTVDSDYQSATIAELAAAVAVEPVPEPSSAALLLLIASGAAYRRRE